MGWQDDTIVDAKVSRPVPNGSLWSGLPVRLGRRLDYAVDRARLALVRLLARWRRASVAMAPRAARDVPPQCAWQLSSWGSHGGAYPEFSAEKAPHVSIIVPVFNQLELTMRCLRSLAGVATHCSFEVIVVDDGSTDGSADWLAACANLQLQRMPSNRGFVEACNAGAALARGEYLVFLNNDTELTDGWLDALIGTFDNVPDCGLVGAKLIYPDGSLQEAGGIVFADGNACNLGRGGDPHDPRYDFVREVDYCSGACIALRSTLFRELGGFDTRYAPAYYEDTDLAFSVHAAGWQVIYQPSAVVVHHEGKTAGTDDSGGVKRFQQINREKFVAKWKQALSEQPTSTDYALSAECCATFRRGQRVLVMDADFPRVDRDSGSMRMFSMLLLLRQLGCHVLFWATAASERDSYARTLEQHGVELVLAHSRGAALRWWYARGGELDIVLLSRLPIAMAAIRLARRYAARAMLVFDTVDLHFLRIARGAALHHSREEAAWAEELRRNELGLMRKADLTLVVSEYERRLLQELAPQADVQVLSNVHPVHGNKVPFAQRAGLMLLGNFEHEPNVDAARWLIGEILPRVRDRLPGATLHIVGHAADEALADCACAGVKVHGYVADLEPILCEVRLALAPLRYGAGVKGKISMAMSYGVPIVTTSIGAEGMGLINRCDAMIADTAEAFADAIAELYGDEALWLGLSEQGLENVRRHFSPTAARDVLEGVLRQASVRMGRCPERR